MTLIDVISWNGFIFLSLNGGFLVFLLIIFNPKANEAQISESGHWRTRTWVQLSRIYVLELLKEGKQIIPS